MTGLERFDHSARMTIGDERITIHFLQSYEIESESLIRWIQQEYPEVMRIYPLVKLYLS